MDRVHGGCRNRNSPSRGPGGCSGGIRSLQSLPLVDAFIPRPCGKARGLGRA
jgi:hypothetical protein